MLFVMMGLFPAAMGVAHFWASPELIRFYIPWIQQIPSNPAIPRTAPIHPKCISSPSLETSVRSPSIQREPSASVVPSATCVPLQIIPSATSVERIPTVQGFSNTPSPRATGLPEVDIW